MNTTLLNGVAPNQQNGHDHTTLGHEIANGLQQNNLLMEAVLQDKEQDAPTAKTDVHDAIIGNAEIAEEQKTKRIYATSISNTLTHCAMFNAAARNLGTGYATRYALYELTNLEAMLVSGDALVNSVAKNEAKYKYAVSHRKDVFGPLEAKLTRILAEVILSGASPNTVEQIRSLLRKLRGARAVAKNPNVPAEDYHSVSQQNYDAIVANFARLVIMVAEDPNYDPMTEDLKVLSLETLLDVLRTANTDVIVAKAELDAARDIRNNFFNTKVTGLVDVFLTAKKVVLANFGFRSDEFKRVKGLSFRRIY